MPRKTPVQELLQAENVPGSPLRRSTRLSLNPSTPSRVSSPVPKDPKARRLSLNQDSEKTNDDGNEAKPATRTRRASVTRSESEETADAPSRTRTRAASLPKEQTTEVKRPATRRRSSSQDTVPQETNPGKRIMRARSGSAPKSVATEDKVLTRSRRLSDQTGGSPLPTSKRLSANDSVVLLEPINEAAQDHDKDADVPETDKVKKKADLNTNLDLSVIKEDSFGEEETLPNESQAEKPLEKSEKVSSTIDNANLVDSEDSFNLNLSTTPNKPTDEVNTSRSSDKENISPKYNKLTPQNVQKNDDVDVFAKRRSIPSGSDSVEPMEVDESIVESPVKVSHKLEIAKNLNDKMAEEFHSSIAETVKTRKSLPGEEDTDKKSSSKEILLEDIAQNTTLDDVVTKNTSVTIRNVEHTPTISKDILQPSVTEAEKQARTQDADKLTENVTEKPLIIKSSPKRVSPRKSTTKEKNVEVEATLDKNETVSMDVMKLSGTEAEKQLEMSTHDTAKLTENVIDKPLIVQSSPKRVSPRKSTTKETNAEVEATLDKNETVSVDILQSSGTEAEKQLEMSTQDADKLTENVTDKPLIVKPSPKRASPRKSTTKETNVEVEATLYKNDSLTKSNVEHISTVSKDALQSSGTEAEIQLEMSTQDADKHTENLTDKPLIKSSPKRVSPRKSTTKETNVEVEATLDKIDDSVVSSPRRTSPRKSASLGSKGEQASRDSSPKSSPKRTRKSLYSEDVANKSTSSDVITSSDDKSSEGNHEADQNSSNTITSSECKLLEGSAVADDNTDQNTPDAITSSEVLNDATVDDDRISEESVRVDVQSEATAVNEDTSLEDKVLDNSADDELEVSCKPSDDAVDKSVADTENDADKSSSTIDHKPNEDPVEQLDINTSPIIKSISTLKQNATKCSTPEQSLATNSHLNPQPSPNQSGEILEVSINESMGDESVEPLQQNSNDVTVAEGVESDISTKNDDNVTPLSETESRKSLGEQNAKNLTSHENEDQDKHESSVDADKSGNLSDINDKVEKLVEGVIRTQKEEQQESEDEDEESGNESNSFLDTMAEEGEEDTPSEDSNQIVDLGESINSTESEIDSDESYERDSFIADDEEIELLSGQEYDLEDDSNRKSRIIKLDSDSNDDSDVKIITKKMKKKTKKPCKAKKASRIKKPLDSSDDNETEKEPEIVEIEDNEDDMFDNKTTEVAPEVEDLAVSKQIEDSVVSALDSSQRRKSTSSIIIHENIRIDSGRKDRLSDRIHKVVELFCSSIKQDGEVSVNVSLDYNEKPETGDEAEDSPVTAPDQDTHVAPPAEDEPELDAPTERKRHISSRRSSSVGDSSLTDALTELSENADFVKESSADRAINLEEIVVSYEEPELAEYVDNKSAISPKKKRKKLKSSETLLENKTVVEPNTEEITLGAIINKKLKKKRKRSLSAAADEPGRVESDLLPPKKVKSFERVPTTKTDTAAKDIKQKKIKLKNPTVDVPTASKPTKRNQRRPLDEDNEQDEIPPVKKPKLNLLIPPTKDLSSTKKSKKRRKNPKKEAPSRTMGVVNEAISFENRRQLYKPEIFPTDVHSDDEWIAEDAVVKPSRKNVSITKPRIEYKTEEYSIDKFHSKDFKNRMLYDPSRVQRVESKKMLKKKASYY